MREDEYYDDEPEGYAEHGDEDGPLLVHDDAPRPRRRLGRGCLPLLVVLVVLGAIAWFGGRFAYDEISSRLEPSPDYGGPGSGNVLFQVEDGATSADIGRDLKSEGVVKSVDAFNEAAVEDENSRDIQVGYYRLKKQMKAEDALAVLVNPENLIQSLVVVPEGARVREIAETIVEETDITKQAVTAALANPEAIGLPAEAQGNPEGYLFPATYSVPPKMTALGLIKQMVTKTVEVEQSLDIAGKARSLGLTPRQAVTVASILEYEVNRSKDYPRAARVIYNRLERDMPLQMDSTVAYLSQREGDIFTTEEERANPSAYNTYRNTGLPPGPIGSPGEETIKAALNPAEGDWMYFVADVEAGTTRFSTTLRQHNKWVEKLQAYCRESEDC